MSIRSANLPQSTPAFSNRALISLKSHPTPGKQPQCMRLLIYDPLQQLSSYIDHFTPRNRPRSSHSSRYIRLAAIPIHGQRTSGSASRTCGYSFPGHGFKPNVQRRFSQQLHAQLWKLSKSGIYTKRKRAKGKKKGKRKKERNVTKTIQVVIWSYLLLVLPSPSQRFHIWTPKPTFDSETSHIPHHFIFERPQISHIFSEFLKQSGQEQRFSITINNKNRLSLTTIHIWTLSNMVKEEKINTRPSITIKISCQSQLFIFERCATC